jgi:RND family efflux transporter MFP subunit
MAQTQTRIQSAPRIPAVFALLLAALFLAAAPLRAEPLTLSLTDITDWKAVYGTVEARDRVPARARLGGILVTLSVAEGDMVTEGQDLGLVTDDKLALQSDALAAQRTALAAQLANAQTDLARGEDLLASGTTTAQRVDALRTAVDVLKGQIASLDAQAQVIDQQVAEGRILAPVSGRVLDVPASRGEVVQPGEPVAVIGGGGTFLRISVPERHATSLVEGDPIEIAAEDATLTGTLSRVYPLIENGRVTADVEITDLPDRFVGARLLVRLPIGTRPALLIPASALTTRAGLDFVALVQPEGPSLRTIVPGERLTLNGTPMVEVLSGLAPGDAILTEVPATAGASHD